MYKLLTRFCGRVCPQRTGRTDYTTHARAIAGEGCPSCAHLRAPLTPKPV